MKLEHVIFALLIALCALFGLLLLVEEAPNSRGVPHAQMSTLLQGGDGLDRHGDLLFIGWLFGALVIALFFSLMLLGLRRSGREVSGKLTLGVSLTAYLAVFTALFLSYRSYARDAAAGDAVPELVGSFPLPSAWMLYGVWVVPVIFIVLFIVRFDRWILSSSDLDEFHSLVANRRSEES